MICLGVDLRFLKLSVCDESVDRFVKSLDIGHITQLPGVSSVSPTVTGLVFMTIDLHLRVPHLSQKLVWFSENENQFIFKFSWKYGVLELWRSGAEQGLSVPSPLC